jgi:hypothetical protein
MAAGEPRMGIPIKPEGTINITTKLKVILGTPILYILLSTVATMYSVMSKIAATDSWDNVFTYWGGKMITSPGINIILPAVLTVIIVGLLSYKGKER